MLDFILDFFGAPAIVIGTIALLGLILQRRSTADVISGSFKTVLGFLIVSAGSGVIVGALDPIQQMILQAFQLEGFLPFDELVVAGVAAKLGRETALIVGLGFLVNVLLARITPFKYIYLTGHMMWIHAGAWAILFNQLGCSTVLTVILGTIVQGCYTTFFPAMAQPFMRKITGSDDIAFGHGQTLWHVVAALSAKTFGKPEESAENVQVSEKWSFFRDMAVSMSLIMLVVSLGAAVFAGSEFVESQLSGGQNFIMYAIIQALTFTAGVLVLLQGVRMFIGEMVPAFQGFAQKVVPGARPALDCPVIYAYGPNSLIVGLIVGTIAQALAILLLVALKWPVPIPSMIVAFFASGSCAIFGNAVAGRRGAIFGGFFWSFVGLITSSAAIKFQLFGDLSGLGAVGVGFIVPDALAIGTVIRLIAKLFGL